MFKINIKTTEILIIIAAFFILCYSSCASGIVPVRDYSFTNSDDLLKNERAENINGLFPEHVYIKTKTQSFNLHYDYQLYKGKIYYKDINETKPKDWQLLKKNGLPSNILEPDFKIPAAIVEITADSDRLYALSDDGIFYYLNRDRWDQKTGFPEKRTLKLNDDIAARRAWAMSRRAEEALWFEDINGNQHHFGTIGVLTNYFLMNDGQEIRYTDTGLPSDFSRNILGPERGRFIAESLDAAGSTVFLINSSGEMYTRLVDFDTIGSDTMFCKYTYDPDYKDEMQGTDYASNFTQWALPSEDWSRQPAIPLEGEAGLTDRISILQNGEGNGARELRVAGLNKSGNPGFYYKQVFDPEWQFKRAPLQLSRFLDPTAEAERGESPDTDYHGRLWIEGNKLEEIELQLEGFNLLEGSCTLKASNSNGELNIGFHPIDMWYYFQRNLPGRDGTPKLMQVTLDLPENKVKGISEHLEDYNLNTFAFVAEALEDCIFIESVSDKFPSIKMIFVKNEEEHELNPEILKRHHLLTEDPAAELYFNGNLSTDNPELLFKQNPGQLLELIHLNNDFLRDFQEEKQRMESQKFSTQLTNVTYSGVEGILKFTGLYRIDYPKFFTVTRHSGMILENIDRSVDLMFENKQWLYNYIEEHLQRRLDYYNCLLENRNSDFVFHENPADYFISAGIDVNQVVTGLNTAGITIAPNALSALPTLILIDHNSDTSFFLEFINFESSMNDYIENRKYRSSLMLKTLLTELPSGGLKQQIECNLIYNGNSLYFDFENGRASYIINLIPEQPVLLLPNTSKPSQASH